MYKVTCACNKVYVGQTGRRINTRLKEHTADIKYKRDRSAIAQHYNETGHEIFMKDAIPIANISNYRERIIREAIEIRKHPYNINREDGYRLSRIWDGLFHTAVTHPTFDHGQSCLTQLRRGGSSLADASSNQNPEMLGLAEPG